MRIFERGHDESLVIGNDVTVTVLEIQPDRVRLAITQTGATPDYREEILVLPSTGQTLPSSADRETGRRALANSLINRRSGLLNSEGAES